MMTSKHNTSR